MGMLLRRHKEYLASSEATPVPDETIEQSEGELVADTVAAETTGVTANPE